MCSYLISLILNTCIDIKFVSGSVEAACGLGLADAVIDLVETGTTMKVRETTRYYFYARACMVYNFHS
jgi:hypothetical protein